MRKFKFFVIGIIGLIFLITCKQFLRDIEEDLSYWATIVYIKNADISRLPLDNDKYASIPCVNDYKINLEIFNEKNHKIREAIDSASDKDIVVFEKGVVGSDGKNPPKAGVDYTLKQKNQNTLELNLSKTFLERSEWSSQNLSPTITLWNKEGRRFPKTFTFKLRANTPPPALEYKAIGKTKDADASGKRYYVLCFEVKDMDKKINTGGELLHKDIAGLSVTAEGGTENSIPLTVNEDGNSFNISNSNGLLLPVASVNKLEAADITTGSPDDIPIGKGIIYFKTDVEVKGAAKTYTFKLFDKKGLKSSEIAVSTSKTQAADAKLFYNSTDISTQAGNSSSPYPINTESSVTVKAKTETSGATIRGTLFKKESGTWSKVSGIDSGTSNEVDITLSSLPTIGSTIEYKISLTTGGTGFAEGTAKEFYVNVKKAGIITINGGDGDAWNNLKNEVENASGAEIIKINGTIKAKNGDTKIEVKRTVKIMGKKGKTSDILDADNQTFIFDIFPSGELTLEKLTLQNGKNTDKFRGGGAIYCAGGKLTTDDISIENCTATQKNGGGIYAKDTNNISLTNTGIKSCTANENGGAIFAQGATVEMTGCTLTGNEAEKNGGAVYVTADGKLNLTHVNMNNNHAKIKGGAVYFVGLSGSADTELTVQGGEFTGNKAKDTSSGDGGAFALITANALMEGVKIKQNFAYQGAGIYVGTDGSGTTKLTLTDSGTYGLTEISNNGTLGTLTAENGGGIYFNSGNLSIQNGVCIKQNKAQKGGGIYVIDASCSMFTQASSNYTPEISGNEATAFGAGIYLHKSSAYTRLTMSGGKISGNRVVDTTGNLTGEGGGIYTELAAEIRLNKGTIENNQAGKGGAVYANPQCDFSMKSSARITLSSGSDEDKPGQNDVYLEEHTSGDAKIKLDGALTGTAPVARITVADSQYNSSTQVLTAGSGVNLANETYKFAVTPQIVGGTPQQWTVGGNGRLKQGRYTEVPYGQLEAYLPNASSTEVNYIEVTGISAEALKGTYASPPDPGPLGELLKKDLSKKVALKLPNSISGLTSMDSCFAHCTNLVSLENLPSGVTNMQACFYDCKGLTTGPDIPATVTNMKDCFRFCDKLQSVKINLSYFGCDFYMTFKGCTALENGGIKVPSGQLGTYKANATSMGTTEAKFSAIP